MFQSRYRAASHFRTFNSPFCARPAVCVSISLSSGFSFQGRNKDEMCASLHGFNLVIERLLISGLHLSVRSLRSPRCFNLVIERLLISGYITLDVTVLCPCFNLVIERLLISGMTTDSELSGILNVSISLSSGFSFQVVRAILQVASISGFNLVIERLLISGSRSSVPPRTRIAVSISLSSGFSFQVPCVFSKKASIRVSISLSSGFSFQVLPV